MPFSKDTHNTLIQFAGEDNELFYHPKTMMVFGDAKATLTTMVQLMKK